MVITPIFCLMPLESWVVKGDAVYLSNKGEHRLLHQEMFPAFVLGDKNAQPISLSLAPRCQALIYNESQMANLLKICFATF